MPLDNESLRVAIAGAASLRGKDLKQWLEEGGFPAGDIRLIDEGLAAGALTEVGGEPRVVQPVDESSFECVQFVFFASSAEFAARHGPSAVRAGATVIDMTGGHWAGPRAQAWIPRLDPVLAAPATADRDAASGRIWISPSAPAIVACSLAAGLAEFSLVRLVIFFLQPVSERGPAGITELEGQTINLLSFQPIPQEVFDTQVAFNLVGRWGASSDERLLDARMAMVREVKNYLADRIITPAIMLVQAPVFYAHAFAAYAEFREPGEPEAFVERLKAVGFRVILGDEPGPSNLAVAGEGEPIIGPPERDDSVAGGYWFWGAADNFRLASVNAARIAERLLVS
jgi:aspartate-semialdehyde dehydrogenase